MCLLKDLVICVVCAGDLAVISYFQIARNKFCFDLLQPTCMGMILNLKRFYVAE